METPLQTDDPVQPKETDEKILVENEVNATMFEQRANLRNAISETNLKGPFKIGQDNFYDVQRSKLYTDG